MRMLRAVNLLMAGCWFWFAYPSHSQVASASKLSAHLINSYTVGSSNIVSGRPRVLKVLGLDSGFPLGMVQAMRDYKAKFPGGKVVVRIYSPKSYSLADNPTTAASDFWTTILERGVNYLAPSDRALITFLEGPNEGQTPTLGYPASAPLQASQWFNQFWTNLTPKIVSAGYLPCIGSIAVGNPGGTTAQIQSYLAAFAPALRQAQAAGGSWSYHAYTINYTTDLPTELYYSLRYRQFYTYFNAAFPDLYNLPLILTEGGVDYNGDPNTSGWRARGTPWDFQRWLNWFDRELQQDSYVLGCTLFENGDAAGWNSFELEPIAGWLRGYLTAPSAPPPAPTGVVARAGTGNIVVTWTNVPLTPTTWRVKRSATSGGPYSPLATDLVAGVQATTYTDAAISSGTRYFYVVTAVNSVGESLNSAEVSAVATNGYPDVVVTSASWSPAALFTGSRAVFSARVLNQGSAPTPAGVTLGVGFTVDGSGTISWAGNYTAALAPSASVLLTADGSPSGVNYWVATEGLHTLTANVDDINRFPESNEGNNILNVPLLVYATGYALNCGGPAVGSFSADSNFSGSSAVYFTTDSIDISGVAGAAPAGVYQSGRAGEFVYLLNYLPAGSNYTVRLHFAETAPNVNAAGERRFNVFVNGMRAFTDLDVFASAGAKFRAVVRELKMRATASGTMEIRFAKGSTNEPMCSGIQLFGSSAPTVSGPITVANSGDYNLILTWQSSAGGIYQLMYKDDLADPVWSALGDPMIGSGTTSSKNVPASGARRFYRVALIN